METAGIFDNKITPRAIAEMFNVELRVASNFGFTVRTIIRPQYTKPMERLHLGHFADIPGTHHVAPHQTL